MEESGLDVVALDTEIFDIDVHGIPEEVHFLLIITLMCALRSAH